MTSLAHQTTRELGGRLSILSRQKRDHVRLDALLHELVATPVGTQQDIVLRRIARLVFPHAFAEESVLWPQLRRTLTDGDVLTLQVEQEHQEVNELWVRLEQAHPVGQERADLLNQLIGVLREDVHDEEETLLPRLQVTVSPRRLRLLGAAWEIVRRTAPTRPHPVVSRRPPGNAMAALPLTVLDRTRDALDSLALRSVRLYRPCTCVSAKLAALVGWVEQFGLLHRGEHASTHRR
jgi:hemerythrin superfamily protein